MTPLMPTKIVDYATLKQAVLSTTNRGDQEFLDATNIFIQVTESEIYSELRTPANEASLLHEPEKDGGSIVLPDSFLEMREVYRQGLPVDRMTQDEYFLATHGNSNKQGYARIGNKIMFCPALNTEFGSGDNVFYLFWVDWSHSWTTDTDTNPLLLGNPDLYLFGVLSEAFTWLEDEGRASYYLGKFNEKVKSIKKQARNDEQSGSDLKVRGGYS
ncbi:phage adaptor protein [Vibrio harveyi]|uniref:phage adaptor protein n=1 Tax=Vibrio harveyi TaxID=669 RepID=UPI00165E2CBB|nr:hypothetical protein [Vibrio harveyi]